MPAYLKAYGATDTLFIYENSFLVLPRIVKFDMHLRSLLPTEAVRDGALDGRLKPGQPAVSSELADKVFGTMVAVDTECHFSLWRNVVSGLWRLTLAEQTVGSAHVNYKELDIDDPEYQLVGTLHSHPGFMPKFSGTDVRNHLKAGNKLHFVYAFNKETKMCKGMSAVAMINGTSFQFDPYSLFPLQSAYNPDASKADPEWVDIIRKSKERSLTTPFNE